MSLFDYVCVMCFTVFIITVIRISTNLLYIAVMSVMYRSLLCVAVVRRAVARRQVRGGVKVKKEKKTESLATVTPLVRSIFDSMFQGQIDEKGAMQKKRRCGICEVQILIDRLIVFLEVPHFLAEIW